MSEGGYSPASDTSVDVHRDLVFAQPAGFRPLSLDLYVPDREVVALCVYLHGGGWRIGTRADSPGATAEWRPSFFARAAAAGLAIASVEYRLSGEAVFPAQLDDVRSALAWLDAHRTAFGITTGRTVAWGTSSGGHLASLVALTPASGIDRVVAWYPPIDLASMPDDVAAVHGDDDRSAASREARLIGAPLGERPDLAAAASPINYVTSDAPPFLLVHGDDDHAVPHAQSVRFAAALEAAGVPVELLTVPGADHLLRGSSEPDLRDAFDRSLAFLLDVS